MPKTNTSHSRQAHFNTGLCQFTNKTFELVNWPFPAAVDDKVLAFQTTRLPPQLSYKYKFELSSKFNEEMLITPLIEHKKSPFGGFNLGLHVGDNEVLVINNRNTLSLFINQALNKNAALAMKKQSTSVISHLVSHQSVHQKLAKTQWLEQVHGNKVVEIKKVVNQAIRADACITREKNIALAVMTADCLPILLSHKGGTEVAAIHGGWRSLAANIIGNTLGKMQSKPADVFAWLGPCIGKNTFEVGSVVKETFIKQNKVFEDAFTEQCNGKYLANLSRIAQLQLQLLGVHNITSSEQCTFEQTDKFYSYRKEKVTGRMASIICRR
jgi:YfiH family protein